MVREDPALIATEMAALQAATDRPFAVNVIPSATASALLDRQIGLCLDLGVPALSFFWDVMPDVVARAASVPVVASGGLGTGAGLVAGAQGIHCGTAFLAATECFVHDCHQARIVEADAADTVRTDGLVLNWPTHASVRVMANSVTQKLGFNLMGHDPDTRPREVIADEGGRPILRLQHRLALADHHG